MVEVLMLSRQETAQIITMKDAIEAVEMGYRAFNEGRAINPFAISFMVPKYNGEVDVKPAYIQDIECAGVKFAGGYWDNPKNYNLPSVISVIILTDGRNGVPLSIMDGTIIGSHRTGAAGGVGAKWLARKDSKEAAIIGTGNQGQMQLMALLEVLPITRVKTWSRNPQHAIKFALEMSKRYGIEVVSADSAKSAVQTADIIVTATPATGPIISKDWVRPGTHINAIGADMPGKQELDPMIFKSAKTIVDYKPQCIEIGEIQHAIKMGILKESDIYAEIGEVISGKKKGRENPDEITVFDSTGIGIQDVSTAYSVYRKAKEQNIGRMVEFF